jgi:hypothetical protein
MMELTCPECGQEAHIEKRGDTWYYTCKGCSIALEFRLPKAFQAIDAFCVPDGTLICTETGLRVIEDIVAGERVFTHTGKLRRVTSTMKRWYTGKLMVARIWRRPFELKLTPEHPIQTPYGFNSAETKPLEISSPVLEVDLDTPRIWNSSAGMSLLGAFYAEGCPDKGGGLVQFCLNIDEKEFAKVIQNSLHVLWDKTAHVTLEPDRHSMILEVNDFEIWEELMKVTMQKRLCYERKVPTWILGSKDRVQFARWAVFGDGHLSHWDNRIIFRQTNLELAWIVYELAKQQKWQPRFGVAKQPYDWKTQYEVDFSARLYPYVADFDPTYVQKPRSRSSWSSWDGFDKTRTWSEIDFAGFVRNLEVEIDNSYIANFVPVHNCFALDHIRGKRYMFIKMAGAEVDITPLKQLAPEMAYTSAEVAATLKVTEQHAIDMLWKAVQADMVDRKKIRGKIFWLIKAAVGSDVVEQPVSPITDIMEVK